ncbi:MAG: NusG domain II-containing protein [Clostridiales bacterium]|jgi:hypothetical protein|nr:NusG domain II-containing protein [Clostridiales bacterium]
MIKDRLTELNKAGIKKGDVIIALILVLASFLALLYSPGSSDSTEKYAILYHKGEEIDRINLDSIDNPYEKPYILNGLKAIIRYEKGSAAFIYSDCRDKLCIERGQIKGQADASVCLPLNLVLIIEGGEREKDMDAVVY